jgi:hypothetical protein
MTEHLKQLQDLQVQLREVNEEFSRAAKSLERLATMSLEQREQVAAGLRKAQERWLVVSEQISGTLQKLAPQSKGEQRG